MDEREGIRRPWLWWWSLTFAWWTLNGFATASQYHFLRSSSDAPITWSHALATGMTSAYLWVPITVFALWSAGRFPLERGRWQQSLLFHLAAGVAVSLFRAVAVLVLNGWIGWYPELPPFSRILVTSFGNNLSLYWMIVGVAHAVHYAQQNRQRERLAGELRTQLVRAQLDTLKSQLHPHFLFNTLNAITSFVHDDPDRAEAMIARLSELLRHALDSAGTQEVSLHDELRFLQPYLEIEQTRFEDRLCVRWQIDPETLNARVPHLLLQPLVENSVRHGISPRSAPGTIEISTARRNGSLHIQVHDDGVGLAGGYPSQGGSGLGLANTRARLEQMYGSEHQFEVSNAPEGGVRVTMVIPFRAAET